MHHDVKEFAISELHSNRMTLQQHAGNESIRSDVSLPSWRAHRVQILIGNNNNIYSFTAVFNIISRLKKIKDLVANQKSKRTRTALYNQSPLAVIRAKV